MKPISALHRAADAVLWVLNLGGVLQGQRTQLCAAAVGIVEALGAQGVIRPETAHAWATWLAAFAAWFGILRISDYIASAKAAHDAIALTNGKGTKPPR